MTGSLLAASASATAGFLVSAPRSEQAIETWLLALPLLVGASWAYLLLAGRRDVSFVPALSALGLGALGGAIVGLGPVLLFFRISGVWCMHGFASTNVGVATVFGNLWTSALPHWICAIFGAAALVRTESRIVLAVAGAITGGVAGAVHVGLCVPLPFDDWTVIAATGHAAAYGVLLPLLAWMADQSDPLSDRSPRRALPATACVWCVPPGALLLGMVAWPEEWLGQTAQAGLVPALLALDLYREFAEGIPEPNPIRHGAVCLIVLALAAGLCSSRRWAWGFWVIWLIHDVAYLGTLVWAAAMLLSNVRTFTADAAGPGSSLNTWPLYAATVGLGYVFAIRVWCLVRREVRPRW